MSRETRSSTSEPVPFLEEWKARRERMRLRSSSSSISVNRSIDSSQSHQEGDPQARNNTLLDKQGKSRDLAGGRSTETTTKLQSHGEAEPDTSESSALKTKEKKGSTQKKHRTQIEKRKLREKRRPTGVANILPLEDPDEHQDHADTKEGNREKDTTPDQDQRTTQVTCPNRTDTDINVPSQEDRENANMSRQSWMEELQKAVIVKRQDNHKLNAELSDKDGALQFLQKEIKTVTQKMQRAEDENKRLKDENQMLLKLMGQLAS
ncbi:PRKC apoptosis WT1 regulator protein-like [Pelobates fuscus]|uniref:PRKC apoptosis WT1 regulator protein-like n=1 Tax=Pelobates fuscus TaxID=191477 RepID=UPI002FE44AA2